ncbi:hypothetical protein GCK32_021316, partial [Trichostrongylus colubriformis]
ESRFLGHRVWENWQAYSKRFKTSTVPVDKRWPILDQ